MSIEANKAIVRRFFEEYWNQRKLETLEVAALVCFTGTQTDTHHVAGRSLPPSNRTFSVAEMFVFGIADGKIVESWAT